MTDYAEGSGSTWEDLDGDPRIVAGAEVLVGRQRHFRGADTPYQDEAVGGRATVINVGVGGTTGARYTALREFAFTAYSRDLVCLRTADGELTEEGRALEAVGRYDLGALTMEMSDWFKRAGILVVPERGQWYVDPRRLAMALGREEKAEAVVTLTTGPVEAMVLAKAMERVKADLERDISDAMQRPVNAYFWRTAQEPRERSGLPWSPLSDHPNLRCDATPLAWRYTPETIGMCERCGTQIPRAGSPHCADCDQILDDEAPDYAEEPPPDYSGESHMDALRAWVRRPMGTV